jgi:cytoskeletal protein CcmA (bactofilin family)
MLHSNSNFQHEPFPERRPTPGVTGSVPGRENAVADSEAAPIPVLGKTLLFRGELTAEEDVILQGRVEGSIRHARNLVIGAEGSVQGDVYASHLTVEGLVEGDLHCSEAVVVRATAQVRGNIYAPRVGIMEGATFNGRIEMDPSAASARSGESRQGARQGSGAQRSGGASSARSVAPPAPPATAAAASAVAGTPLASTDVDQMLSSQRPTKK